MQTSMVLPLGILCRYVGNISLKFELSTLIKVGNDYFKELFRCPAMVN